jgi:drug/metabolite transporter (DMT)-like permease
VIHAVWNLLLAGSRDTEATTAIVLVVGAVVGIPFAIVWWDVDARAWPFVAASSVLEVSYFALLAAAYRRAELSVVYPLARGFAPVLVLVGAVAFTGATTSAPQVVGVLLVATGILLVRGFRRAHTQGVVFGLLIACCIASYTVVDKHGVAHASPLPYLELISVFMALGYAGWFVVARGVQPLRAGVEARSLVAGVATFAAYALVLAALRLAPAASVSAVRESSVLIATALAALVLNERVSRRRLAGAALVVGGIALLAT